VDAVSRHDVVLPQFADGMTEAFVAEWYAEPGGSVEAGEPLVEPITDKVNMVMDAPVSGRWSSCASKPRSGSPSGTSCPCSRWREQQREPHELTGHRTDERHRARGVSSVVTRMACTSVGVVAE
jgi:hypothetical protein